VNIENNKTIFKVKDVAGNLEEYEHNGIFQKAYEKMRAAWEKQYKNGKCSNINEAVWSGEVFRKRNSPKIIE
jgi:hypothetical protein